MNLNRHSKKHCLNLILEHIWGMSIVLKLFNNKFIKHEQNKFE